MEVGLSSTLLALLLLQALVSLILMGPRVLSRPLIKLIRGSSSNAASSAITKTVGAILVLVAGANVYELYSRNTRQGSADVQRTMMEAVDMHRAWIATVLSIINALLIFVNKSLATEAFEHDRLQLNLQALKRQVEGLTNEYNRVSATKDTKTEESAALEEVTRLKKRVTELQAEKHDVQDLLAAAQSERDSAQKQVQAIKAQSENLAKEWDRVVDEKNALESKLNQLTGGDRFGKKVA